MKRLIASIAILGLLLTVVPAPAEAAASLRQSEICSPPTTKIFKVCMSENRSTANGNDMLIATQTTLGLPPSNIPHLSAIDHTLPDGHCANWLNIGDDWNDCISGAAVYIPTGAAACFYKNNNYGGIMYKVGPYDTYASVFITFDSAFNDNITSVRFSMKGGC